MFECDAKIYRDRIESMIRLLENELYSDFILLKAQYVTMKKPVPYAERKSLQFRQIEEGEVWGKNWDNAWFHLKGIIPEHFRDKELCLEIHLGGEALLVDETGCPMFSFSAGSVFDAWYTRKRFDLKKKSAPGDVLEFDLEVSAYGMYGLRYTICEEHPSGYQEAHANRLRLCAFDREKWHFLLELTGCLSLYDALPEKDYRRRQILNIMNNAANIQGKDLPSVREARRCLRKILNRKAYSSAMTAYSVGHAHIDVAWLWPIREGIRKAARTFSTQLYLLEKYPDYIFGASQAYLYEKIRENHPALYRKIKKRIREGRWEVQGGMWVESDCNIVGGESLVRQFLYGKHFFRNEFGIEVKTLWLPDVFGYPASLPQIIRKAGCDTFMTTKLFWNRCNSFPYTSFRWKGIDGSEIPTHFPPTGGYSNWNRPEELIHAQNAVHESSVTDGFLNLFGIGDGGGGPAEEQIERGILMRDLEGCPKVRFTKSGEFFEEFSRIADELPEWFGELYLERHQGTYTTQARTKRGNRKCEEALGALETFACLQTDDSPKQLLEKCWKLLLVNQFHDVIPGSSIEAVYEEAERSYAEILSCCEKETVRLAEKLFSPDKECAVLCNTLSDVFSGVIELPEGWSGAENAETGKVFPCQKEGSRCFVSIDIAGCSLLTLKTHPEIVSSPEDKKERILENDQIVYHFNEKGELLSAYDKTAGREVLSGVGNRLSIYSDGPERDEFGPSDAWDIEPFYKERKADSPECVSAGTSLAGSVRSTLDFKFRYGNSIIRQRIILEKESKRLNFETEVEWYETYKMLRVAFPVEIQASDAVYDIQFGFVRRPVNTNTSWEQAQFESVGQRYADLSESGYGAALLNDCKYGYRVRDSILDLCLLRSCKHPDFFADQGQHRFTYSFLPHEKSLTESCVMREAANLNRPPLFFNGLRHNKRCFPCRLESNGIVLSAIKKEEFGKAVILRLVERKGERSKGVLTFPDIRTSVRIQETNLVEWENGVEYPVKGRSCTIEMKPFEIKTLRVYLK